ncbi:MAG TPA: tetratricopeptide repeat protein, partial [Candidatus Ozemobacteraceae bacterium]|nr:tetratricopeptide repeat protein [Candidatus Ozemobacteraceae bacterium]
MMHHTPARIFRKLVLGSLLAGCVIPSLPPAPVCAQVYDNTNVLIESAVNHIYQKRYDKAHEALKKAYEQAPRHPSVHFNLGRLFELTGNFSEAQKEYQLAAMLDPTMIAARRGIARVAVELKRQGSMEVRAVLDQAAREPKAVEVPRTGFHV